MRLAPHFYRAARHGAGLYRQARNMGRQFDAYVGLAHRTYATVIQPGLRAGGYDTREMDRQLVSAHSHYSMVKEASQAGLRIADGLAAHSQTGFSYPH
jgi:hypothetical protein